MKTLEQIRELVGVLSAIDFGDEELDNALSDIRQALGEPIIVFRDEKQQAECLKKTRRRIEDRLRKDTDTVWRLARLLGINIEIPSPQCCGKEMVFEGSDGDWWNTTEHYKCSVCGAEIQQPHHH